jgi:hypothetical protein
MTDNRGLEPPPIEPPPPPEAGEPVPVAPEPVTQPAPFESPAAPASPASALASEDAARLPERLASQRERLLLISTGLLFLICVLLGLMVFAPSIAPIKFGVARQAASLQTDEEIETVSRRFARNFLSIDYRTLESDFEAIRQDATGDLLRQLSQVSNVVREPYRKARSISTGRPKQIVVISKTKDVASVQVIVSVTVRNSKRPEPQTNDQPLQLTLIRTGSGWKVSQVYQAPANDQDR